MRNGRVRRAKPTVFYLFHWTLFFFIVFLSNVRRSNNNNMRGMQCDPVLIHFFRYHFLCFDRLEWKILQNLCVRSAVSKGEWVEKGGGEGVGPLEHADDLGADIFHTFHRHNMIKLELEMSSSKWQTTRYVDRYIHTYIVHLCICQIHGQLSLDIASAVPPIPPPPFTRLNATYDRNISKWISK